MVVRSPHLGNLLRSDIAIPRRLDVETDAQDRRRHLVPGAFVVETGEPRLGWQGQQIDQRLGDAEHELRSRPARERQARQADARIGDLDGVENIGPSQSELAINLLEARTPEHGSLDGQIRRHRLGGDRLLGLCLLFALVVLLPAQRRRAAIRKQLLDRHMIPARIEGRATRKHGRHGQDDDARGHRPQPTVRGIHHAFR